MSGGRKTAATARRGLLSRLSPLRLPAQLAHAQRAHTGSKSGPSCSASARPPTKVAQQRRVVTGCAIGTTITRLPKTSPPYTPPV